MKEYLYKCGKQSDLEDIFRVTFLKSHFFFKKRKRKKNIHTHTHNRRWTEKPIKNTLIGAQSNHSTPHTPPLDDAHYTAESPPRYSTPTAWHSDPSKPWPDMRCRRWKRSPTPIAGAIPERIPRGKRLVGARWGGFRGLWRCAERWGQWTRFERCGRQSRWRGGGRLGWLGLGWCRRCELGRRWRGWGRWCRGFGSCARRRRCPENKESELEWMGKV